ncbi:MAG: vWA domain-containing protein [Gordonia sp. (in: high G+C Gram-positive bacteria)]|uniref:vWA domain-containing protein n=1 Tax=Gordonia sp. (in: high G+C Gram-positive bacteria) TaxID=84139 RepID=UPI0039E25DDD
MTHLTSAAARRLLVIAVVGLLAATTALAFGGPAARAADGTPGVDRFGACVASAGKGRVLLLIDQSSSLGQSDPKNSRDTAARLLTGQLVDYSSSSGSQVDVAVSGFSGDYRSQLDWTRLDSGSLSTVNDAVTAVTSDKSGIGTDYLKALEGARSTFARGAPAAGQTPQCQMLAWFTDGKLLVLPSDGQDGQNLTAAAQESLCREGGVADQLRTAGIVTVGIGLTGPDAKAADFGLVEGIATGSGGAACGKITTPPPGDFLLADGIESLLFAFDRLGNPGQAPTVAERGVCVKKVCDEGKHYFVLDETVDNVGILAAADNDGLVPVLVSPDGTETRLERGEGGSTKIGGVAVAYDFPSDKSVSIRMSDSAANQWTGVWSLVFLADSDDDAKSKSSIHISAGLRPAVKDADKAVFRAGESPEITFELVNKDGKAVDTGGMPGKVALTADVIPASGPPVSVAKNLDKRTLTAPQTVALQGVAPGPATLKMRLTITTAPAKEKGSTRERTTTLEPINVELPITVAPPAGYPTVDGIVNFGTLTGAGEQTATLAVTGPGCVWLAETEFSATPDDADGITVTSPNGSKNDCLKLGDGEKGTLTVTLTAPQPVNGNVGGTLTVMASPKEAGAEDLAVPVTFQGALQKPLDDVTFWIVLVVALILGPGIPLLLLYLFKWLNARIPGRALRATLIPVRVSGSRLERDGRPFEIRDNDLVQTVAALGESPVRRLDLGGAVLTAKTGFSPFGTGYVVASAAGTAGAAGPTGDTVGKTPDARLPLAVHNHWVLFHDASGPADTATVLVLAAGEADAARIEKMAREIDDHAPKVLAELRAKAHAGMGADAPDDTPPPPPNPFGGPPGPPGGNPFGGGSGAPGGNPFAGSGPAPSGPPTGANPFGGSGPAGPPPANPMPGGNPFGGSGTSGPPSFGPPSFGSPPGGDRPGSDPSGPNPFGGSGPAGPAGPPPGPGGPPRGPLGPNPFQP